MAVLLSQMLKINQYETCLDLELFKSWQSSFSSMTGCGCPKPGTQQAWCGPWWCLWRMWPGQCWCLYCCDWDRGTKRPRAPSLSLRSSLSQVLAWATHPPLPLVASDQWWVVTGSNCTYTTCLCNYWLYLHCNKSSISQTSEKIRLSSLELQSHSF